MGNDETGSWCSRKMQISSSGVRVGHPAGQPTVCFVRVAHTCVQECLSLLCFSPPYIHSSICLSIHPSVYLTGHLWTFWPSVFVSFWCFLLKRKTSLQYILIMFFPPQTPPRSPSYPFKIMYVYMHTLSCLLTFLFLKIKSWKSRETKPRQNNNNNNSSSSSRIKQNSLLKNNMEFVFDQLIPCMRPTLEYGLHSIGENWFSFC